MIARSRRSIVCLATMPAAVGYVRAGRMAVSRHTDNLRPTMRTCRRSPRPASRATRRSWYGLSAPAGTPRDIINRLHAVTIKVMALPEINERLAKAGFEVVTSTPEEFAAFTKSEIQKWGKLVKATGLKAD